MAILDTDIIIDYINGAEEIKSAIESVASEGPLLTTIINQYELLKGTENEKEHAVVVNILSKLEVHTLDDASIAESSLIYKKLKRNGKLIPEQDILIAGIAISKNQAVMTRDAHFKGVQGLKMILIE